MMKAINVEITGTSPLLMNNIMSANLGQESSRKALKSYNPTEEAERSAYWTTEGKKKTLCVPARCYMLVSEIPQVTSKPIFLKNMLKSPNPAGASNTLPLF
jgi:hypothetical protein